ncbi:hypothetical protein AcV5_001162 [Taiwanofungus camphoratus]|nr:hypothetical protein AcV5_001162 [Antrodia cinnamomea]
MYVADEQMYRCTISKESLSFPFLSGASVALRPHAAGIYQLRFLANDDLSPQPFVCERPGQPSDAIVGPGSSAGQLPLNSTQDSRSAGIHSLQCRRERYC